MPCLIRRVSKLINKFFAKYIKSFISFFLILSHCFFLRTLPLEAKLETLNNDKGLELQRSIESLRDLEYQTWQLVAYPQIGNEEHLVLRIVGFKGSLRLNHPTKLDVKSGLKTWKLEDITLKNPQLANDNRDAAAEFKLEPLLDDLNNNRPLRLALAGGFNELPVPPYIVKEWRSLQIDG